jgi:hypothetical protein
MFKSTMQKLFSGLQGRTTSFITGFFIMGHIMQWFHRLDAQYITFMSLLMSFVLGHSIQENAFDKTPSAPAATTPV